MGLFRRLFGPKKPSDAATTTSSSSTLSQSSKEKKRWSFVRSSNSNTTGAGGNRNKRDAFSASFDDNKHAIAVAAATAAVAEAALAAAQAAAEVVRLTGGSGRCAAPASEAVNRLRVEALAAVRIQSAFRGYLARRALRALKALVKLQALVRGHIVRKQTADMLRRMQTLVRVQTRVRASRTFSSDSLQSGCRSCHSHYAKAGSMDGLEKARIGSYRLDRWMEECLWSGHGTAVVRNRHADDDRSDKILEVDTWEPNEKSLRSNHMFKMPHHALASDHLNQSFIAFDSPSKSSTKLPNKSPSFIPREVSSFNSLKLPSIKDDAVYRTAENSPQVYSASSRPGSSNGRGPFTPTRSECSWGFFNGYSGYPSYMAYTESSRAKFRSQSAPRQRIEFERYGSKKQSLQGSYDAEICSERSFRQSNESRHKAYPPSSRLNRLGSTNVR